MVGCNEWWRCLLMMVISLLLYSLSLRQPAWWASYLTSTWCWTTACVCAGRRVSQSICPSWEMYITDKASEWVCPSIHNTCLRFKLRLLSFNVHYPTVTDDPLTRCNNLCNLKKRPQQSQGGLFLGGLQYRAVSSKPYLTILNLPASVPYECSSAAFRLTHVVSGM